MRGKRRPPKHIPYAETEFGFIYGDARIERFKSVPATGEVQIKIETSRTKKYPMIIKITNTGLIKVFQKGEWKVTGKL